MSILRQTIISIMIIHIISTGQTDGTGAITTIGTDPTTIIIIIMIGGAMMITIGTDHIMDTMVLHTWRGNLRDTGIIFRQTASSQATTNRTASNMSIQALAITDLTVSIHPVQTVTVLPVASSICVQPLAAIHVVISRCV